MSGTSAPHATTHPRPAVAATRPRPAVAAPTEVTTR